MLKNEHIIDKDYEHAVKVLKLNWNEKYGRLSWLVFEYWWFVVSENKNNISVGGVKKILASLSS